MTGRFKERKKKKEERKKERKKEKKEGRKEGRKEERKERAQISFYDLKGEESRIDGVPKARNQLSGSTPPEGRTIKYQKKIDYYLKDS